MIATGMSLTGSETGSMTEEQKQTAHLCNMRKQVAFICTQVSSSKRNTDLRECRGDRGNRRKSSPFVEENDYSASFNSGANIWLAFWLCLVTSSYFLLSKKVNFFSGCRVKPEENASLANRSIPNERTDNINDATSVDDALSYSDGLGSPHSTCSSTYYDAFSEISDFDGTSYGHSLLSLDEEDNGWLSDSMISENPSTPLSYSHDSFCEISDVGTPSYWNSLLKFEEEDSDWILDKASYSHSLLSLEEEDSEWLSDSMVSENPSSPLSYNGDSFSKISDVGLPSYWDSLLKLEEEDNVWILDKASYSHSLLSLEEEDSAWLSDSMISEDPSSPLSSNGGSFTDISDVGTPSYWDSLLRLEKEDNEWISGSKQGLQCVQHGSPISSYKVNWGAEVLPSVSTSSFTEAHCEKPDVFSAEHRIETADTEELNGDEPLFWPFKGEFSWDSEESSFCSSPRKRLVFDSGSTASRIKRDEQKGDDDFDSSIVLDKECAIETLVGLKEFDGHEGLDSEFIGDGFMLEESL
ncbi:hypothetical protein MTR_2g098620 [Medicago truncatula]|uniref:Uncharacterized protein n=1 Tax=Medicago truncatula TaxID=3880 RepID=G7IHS0_MEDTR|nr:hypothetical protein MTR_2g098620 [Medicago truncatula]